MRDDANNRAFQTMDDSEAGFDLSLKVMKAMIYKDADAFALGLVEWLKMNRLRVSGDVRETVVRSLDHH